MDLGRLRGGELLTGLGAIGLLVVLSLDWYGSESGWDSLEILRILFAAQALAALTLIGLTVLARPVAIPVAATVMTLVFSLFAVLCALYRVGIDQPGSYGPSDVDVAAYVGLACVTAVAVGAWRALADERTHSTASRRQAERVLAVRGAPRPPPPERDPDRPAPSSDT